LWGGRPNPRPAPWLVLCCGDFGSRLRAAEWRVEKMASAEDFTRYRIRR